MIRLFYRLCAFFIPGRKRRDAFMRRHYWDMHPDERILREVQLGISTARLHEKAFGEFKNRCQGQDVVLVAGGPSVREYRPIPGAVHIGVNAAYKCAKVDFDYLFVQDVHGRRGMLDEINAYRPPRGCVKFYGIMDERKMGNDYTIPESDALLVGARRYRVDNRNSRWGMQLDITSSDLACYGTVALPAAQFALWMNPRRLYLVGCDCSTGYFYCDGEGDPRLAKRHDDMLRGYRALKRFASKWYPATEIISINPVGLKGMFTDMAQNGD